MNVLLNAMFNWHWFYLWNYDSLSTYLRLKEYLIVSQVLLQMSSILLVTYGKKTFTVSIELVILVILRDKVTNIFRNVFEIQLIEWTIVGDFGVMSQND
jgi:hypothetical protein